MVLYFLVLTSIITREHLNFSTLTLANCLHESRLMLGIAFILLISGINENSKSRKNCGLSDHRHLSIGGILCFIHGLFAVSYYVSAAAVVREERKHNIEGQENKPNQQPVAPAWPYRLPYRPPTVSFTALRQLHFYVFFLSQNFNWIIWPLRL